MPSLPVHLCDFLWIFFTDFNNGFICSRFGIFFITKPWYFIRTLPGFVFIAPWSSQCCLVRYVLLHTQGPSRKRYIFIEIMWRFNFTKGLHSTNYVTSDGNWLYQNLFSDLIKTGVITNAFTNFTFVYLQIISFYIIDFHSLQYYRSFCVNLWHLIPIKSISVPCCNITKC